MIAAVSIAAVCLGALGIMTVMVIRAPLVDENEQPIDEVQDDPRPAQVLREAWADRETLGGVA